MKQPEIKRHKMAVPAKIAESRANLALTKDERKAQIQIETKLPTQTPVMTKKILLHQIEVNPARQPRVSLDREHVERIREAYENNDTVTPSEVFSETGEAP